jgi:hypothetical protein
MYPMSTVQGSTLYPPVELRWIGQVMGGPVHPDPDKTVLADLIEYFLILAFPAVDQGGQNMQL